MLRWPAALVLFASLAGCGGVVEVSVREAQPALVAEHEVAVIGITRIKRFRNGKRIEVMAATLVVREKGERRKLQVAEGDDVIIGAQRFLVARIEAGGPTSAGVLTLQTIE
ncbi:MAG: hypothetical protein JNK04_20560 [Myxococcales bacterium]|nr:hypothetical protein [Myxococcales bacterium]